MIPIDPLTDKSDAELQEIRDTFTAQADAIDEILHQREKARTDADVQESLPYLDAALAHLTGQGYTIASDQCGPSPDFRRYAIVPENGMFTIVEGFDERRCLTMSAMGILGNLREWHNTLA